MPPLYSAPLLAGDAGTSQTIDKIRQLVDEAWRDYRIREFAFDIVRNAGVSPFDKFGQTLAIYVWASSVTYFLNDPINKEALMPAVEMLKVYRRTGAIPGDCDDINAILLPSLLGAIGIDTRLVTVAADGRDPSIFSHIYAEANVGDDWIPVDAARPGAEFGMAPPSFYRREWWSLSSGDHAPYESEYQREESMAATLGDYSHDPRCQSVLRGVIGPTGIAIASPQPSGVNVKALGLLALIVGGLLLLGGKLK